MSRLDDLPPDQRATLSLLLRRGKSYAEVAGMLEIDERAVHDRAHAALAVLAAREARELTAEQREQVGDYLLGQRSGVAEHLATRTYLDGSPQARAWATALAAQLEPLAGAALPEIPNGASPAARPAAAAPATAGAPASVAPPSERGATHRERASQPRSPSGARTRGALLLAAIAAVIVVVVVLLTSGGGSSSNSAGSGGGSGSETSASATSSTGTQKAQAKEDKRITLTPPDASSKAVGVAEVLSEGSQYAFYLAAQHLAPSKGKGFFYAVWLYNSPSSYEALSRAPDVGSSGNVQGGALLPKDAGKYHTMLLTRETASKPTSPGPIILRGAFALH
jgi:plasmid stability protein